MPELVQAQRHQPARDDEDEHSGVSQRPHARPGRPGQRARRRRSIRSGPRKIGLGRTDSCRPLSLTGRKLPDQQPALDVAVERRPTHRAGRRDTVAHHGGAGACPAGRRGRRSSDATAGRPARRPAGPAGPASARSTPRRRRRRTARCRRRPPRRGSLDDSSVGSQRGPARRSPTRSRRGSAAPDGPCRVAHAGPLGDRPTTGRRGSPRVRRRGA